MEGRCGVDGYGGFGWNVHLFSDAAVVVADQIFVEEFGVDTGSEDVGAVDMVVQIADKVLAGRSDDGGDVLPMTTSTEDHDFVHSLYAFERLTPIWKVLGSSPSSPR